MERTAASGRTQRHVIKRIAFSPEPTSSSKKVTPKSKVLTKNNKKKSTDTAGKNKAQLPRKSLPASLNAAKPTTNDDLNKSATESSTKIIKEKPTPEIKLGRLKLKTFTEIPSSSNGVKVNEVKVNDVNVNDVNVNDVKVNAVEVNDVKVNENIAKEKKQSKDKVSPLKISLSKHRPSLPAMPTKSPPVTIERPSFSGRTCKPARSKEYPGHEEALPSSSNARRKRSKIPKPLIPPVSVPSTPAPITPAPPSSLLEFMSMISGTTTGNFFYRGPTFNHIKLQTPSPMYSPEPSPPLPAVKNELPAHLASYLPDRPHRSKSKNISDFAPSLVSRDIKRKSLTGTADEKLRSPSSQNAIYPSAEPMVVDDESITIEEEDINIAGNFEMEDDAIFEDQIEYLKSLHPHLKKSFEALEEHYEDEYFLREILTQDIVDSEDSIPDEEELDIDGIESFKNINYNLTFSTMKYAKCFVKMFPNRVSFDQIPDHIQTFLNENDATGNCLKIFLEILQNQCCMELAVKKHINPLASYYLYSLQNATLLRSRIFLHFSYELVYAHEWLIRHLEEDVLASYLMLLKFLQAAGTTLGNILITSANPKDQTNITVNEHIRDMLEEKIRDPFTRMLTHLDRKLTNHDTFLMLISPGIKLKNEMNNAVYHAHEQLFAGLTNMGCTIEKIIIKDDDDLSEDFTVIDACEFAVNFIKNKIIDAVKRRPNERIFIASWGVTCLFVHEAVIDVDGVSGIIDLAMPIKSRIESRGKIGDRILLTYCPTMVVSGEDSGEVPDTTEMLNNFHISTGLCVVGKADSSLIVEPSLLASYGITQACISRIILNHVMDFIERVVIDTHNDIHTKKLEVEYPWIITEDLNDHVMRDDTAYGVDETFVDDEEDPSLIKPKELVVVDEIPKTGEPLPEEEDIDLDSSCEIINPEPEPPTVKLEYPENGTSEFVENVKSAIVEHPPTYGYRPSSYTQPILVDTDFETGDVLNEFLDNTVNYETMEVVSEAPTEEAYDEEMEFEEQMAAEAIEGGYTGDQNGYE